MRTPRNFSFYILVLSISCIQAFSFGTQGSKRDVNIDEIGIFGRHWSRRQILSRFGPSVSPLILSPLATQAIQTTDGLQRVEEIGGGFDLMSPPPLKATEAVYPASCKGVWNVKRVIASIEGDPQIAKTLWKILGANTGDFRASAVETYETRFVPYSSESVKAVTVVDRAFEMQSRNQQKAVYENNVLRYDNIELAVVQRSIEPPNDNGFGSNELIRTTSKEAIGEIVRVARIQRRFRRAFDENNRRVLEGLEIMKTYRVLDGIAGVEMPTSTTKFRLILTPKT